MKIKVKARVPWQNVDINKIMELESGTTVGGLLEKLGIKDDLENYLVAVNGKIEFTSYVLKDGEEVAILPALIGG